MTAKVVALRRYITQARASRRSQAHQAARVAKLRRYIAHKHAKTLEHTRWLGRPAFPVRYRWKHTRSVPYLRYLGRQWSVRANVAWKLRVSLADPEFVIRFVFGPYAEQALAVARCESGSSMTPRAHNGQYLGTFQMGSSERARYGHGDTVLEQARAAYRYFVDSGRDWSPWSCKPWGVS